MSSRYPRAELLFVTLMLALPRAGAATERALGPASGYPMRRVPAGEYAFGGRTFTIGPDLWFGEVEVTQALWARATGRRAPESEDSIGVRLSCLHKRCDPDLTADELPVHSITLAEAIELANALSALDGLRPAYGGDPPAVDATADGYRLPLEVEWEYVAVASDPSAAHDLGAADVCVGGNTYDATARREVSGNIHDPRPRCDDRYAWLAPVGSFAAGPLGVSDLVGNVAEYTWGEWVWTGEAVQYVPHRTPVPLVRGGSFREAPAAAVPRGGHVVAPKPDVTIGVRFVRGPPARPDRPDPDPARAVIDPEPAAAPVVAAPTRVDPAELAVRKRVEPRIPAKATTLGPGRHDCVADVTVDAKGVPTEVVFLACPEVLREATYGAFMDWRWVPPSSPVIVTLTVHFVL